MKKLSDYDYIFPTPGSFAAFTLQERLPKILQDIIDSNDLAPTASEQLKALKNNVWEHQIQELPVRKLALPYWSAFFRQYVGKPLSQTPFFFGEVYFYQLICHIIGNESLDHFEKTKQRDVISNENFIVQTSIRYQNGQFSLSDLLLLATRGNQADLSQLSTSRQSEGPSLLMDHRLQLIDRIASCDRVHFVLDNAGIELFTDLLLVHHLVKNKGVAKVFLHFKQQPIFVSDALIKDFWWLIEFLEGVDCSDFGGDIRQWIEEDTIRLASHAFWTAPAFFTQLPEEVIANDAGSLIISKGDANYRRFFEDRDFSYSANFPELFHHCRYDLFALRTLKSELQTSLDPAIVAGITDKDWMVNGKHAVIQHLIDNGQ